MHAHEVDNKTATTTADDHMGTLVLGGGRNGASCGTHTVRLAPLGESVCFNDTVAPYASHNSATSSVNAGSSGGNFKVRERSPRLPTSTPC
jgi:hypothetical protein